VCLPAPLADHVDGLNGRHRNALQERDQLGDRGNTKDLDPSTSWASPAWRSGTITRVKPAC
jgi:hypothetical protein